VLGDIPLISDDRVLVDFRTADDAGVYAWDKGPALVQTVDFFTPVVDDPYVFGQIAAANAVSDVYAMGGEPRTALAIAAMPKDGPGTDVIKAIFRGGFDKLREAGVALLGGHTVTDQEIKFGYAVTGAIDPARILTNAGARPGNVVLLTKPLGTGIIATAIKFNRAEDHQIDAAVQSMTRLNRDAAAVLRALPPGMVTACTDITGFGLAGHASEMAIASGVTIAIDTADLPVLEGALALAAQNIPGGNRTNETHFGGAIEIAPDLPSALKLVCFDPQTSGGLFIAVDARAVGHVQTQLREAGVHVWAIGQIEETPADRRLALRLR
jgi:selenide,water dikinase